MEPQHGETANKPTRKEHGTVEKEEADEGEGPRQTAREGEQKVAKDAENKKTCNTPLDLCVSSLRRGHANLLCIVPIFQMMIHK